MGRKNLVFFIKVALKSLMHQKIQLQCLHLNWCFFNHDSDTTPGFQKSCIGFFLWRLKVVTFGTLVAKLIICSVTSGWWIADYVDKFSVLVINGGKSALHSMADSASLEPMVGPVVQICSLQRMSPFITSPT